MCRRMTDATQGAGRALFRLVRHWSRRWPASATGAPRQETNVVVAVDALAAGGADAATVGGVAHQLGVDRSVASRLVADAVAAGLVERSTSSRDARRAAVSLTTEGAALLAHAEAWQEEAFARLTADWEDADRARLAGYLCRLAAETIDAELPSRGD